VALDDMSGVDCDGADAAPAGAVRRSGDKAADRAGLAILRAEESITFAIEQPAPDITVLRVTGELDMLTTPLLESCLRERIEAGCGHLVVDLRGVSFLAVAGLRCLIIANKTAPRLGVQLHLTGTDHRAVARPLEIARLHPSFDIHPTVESVVAICDGKPRYSRPIDDGEDKPGNPNGAESC